MACVSDTVTQLAAPTPLCHAEEALPAPRAEDAESDPSTEFGSDASELEYSEDDCDGGSSASSFSVEDTLVIFDWDDTMLPTTWIEGQGLSLDHQSVPTREQEAQLREMAEHALQTLRVAKSLGKVVLVTNAECGWVELSCQKFMPALFPSLLDVRILSARSTYEGEAAAGPSEWKYLAFRSELGIFCDPREEGRRKNIISIGDSAHEREALIRVMEDIPNSCVKALKFSERPGVEQLQKEHQLIGECLGDIVDHDGSLDLHINCA